LIPVQRGSLVNGGLPIGQTVAAVVEVEFGAQTLNVKGLERHGSEVLYRFT
jgi:hypothetical protein